MVLPMGPVGFQKLADVVVVAERGVSTSPHLVDRLLVRPPFPFHSVQRRKDASPVNSTETMDQNRVILWIIHYLKKLRHVLFGRDDAVLIRPDLVREADE